MCIRDRLHPPRTSSGKQLSDMRRSNLARGAYELDRFVTCPQAALLPDINCRPNLCPPGAGPTREVLRSVSQDGRAILVFTEYTDTLRYLRDYFVPLYRETLGCYSGAGGQLWDGSRWRSVTKDVITSTLREGRLKVLICTDAASEGLNLQAAGGVINYDLPWNPSKVEQRIGRVDRIGQQMREIRVINFFLEDSVDQRVYAVLRERCGLFEHFVGSMQPVLAAAQTMLLGKKPEDTEALRKLASDQLANPVVSQMFPDSDPEPVAAALPPLSRAEMIEALSDLSVQGIKVESSRNGNVWKLTVEGANATFATDTTSLEADASLTPLSPFHPLFRRLGDSLEHAGERRPLIIGTAARGGFRAASAWWAGGGEARRIELMSELRACLATWDGAAPSSETWMATLRQASDEARRRVEQAEQVAAALRKGRLESQREAARRRLLLELGRFLVCVVDSVGNLNEIFFQQMSRRDLATSLRLERCFAKLGRNYPEWTTDVIFGIERFRVEANQNEKLARLIGSELDAALDDPRWNSVSA